MKIKRIIWLENILYKISVKHGVSRYEVVEVLNNKPLFLFVEKGFRNGENVYSALGKTTAGRYLIVFFIYKKNGGALIVSARAMSLKERKRYEKR